MSTKTSNYNLVKPALTDSADITVMNANWDTIDLKMKAALQGNLEVALPIAKGGTGGTTQNSAVENLFCRMLINNTSIVDANTLVHTGIHKVYVTDSTLATNNHYPYVCGNLLVVSNMESTSYTYIAQMFFSANGTTLYRFTINNGSTWTEWAKTYSTLDKPTPSDLGVTATSSELNYVKGVTSAIQTQLNDKYSISVKPTLPENADFNTYITPGQWGSSTWALSNTLKNCPYVTAGSLTVYYSDTSTREIHQIWESRDGRVFTRYSSNSGSTWSSWKEYLTNILSSDMYGTTLPTAGKAGRIFFKKV